MLRNALIIAASAVMAAAPYLPLPVLRWLTIAAWYAWKGRDGRRQLNRYLLVKLQQEGVQ